MRLKLLVGGVIALAFALVIVACGGSSASSSTAANTIEYKPGVRLVCIESPCGSNQSKNIWRGYYIALENDFPPESPVLVTAISPNSKPYPFDQYTRPRKMFGVEGSLQHTDKYGELPEFKWAAVNEGGPVDPPGVYRITFRFKYHGEIVAVHTHLKMVKLP